MRSEGGGFAGLSGKPEYVRKSCEDSLTRLGIEQIDLLDPDDWRRQNPRFSEENFAQNLALVDVIEEIAATHSCTPAQVALAWVLQRHPHTVLIPGTTKKHRVEENAHSAGVTLSESDMSRLSALPDGHGTRYG